MSPDVKNPTIQDVAIASGFSTATVSRVLSSPDLVKNSTKQRVEDVIASIGFTPNTAAQALRRKAGRTLLIALPNLGNSFFGPIVDAIERACVQRGYDVLIANRHPSSDSAASLLNYYTSNRADGLLLFDGSARQSDWEATIGNRKLFFPTVNVCETILDSGLPSVVSDNFGGVGQAVAHLVENGHKKIGHISAPPDNILHHDRKSGFEAALCAHALNSESTWEFFGPFAFSTGDAAAANFAACKNRPTAVFCDSDEIAIGFIHGLKNRGIQCPKDVSVVGFDDIPMATYASPPLTTIRQQHAELGRVAAEQIMNMLEFPNKDIEPTTILDCRLVKRESVRKI